MEPDNSLPRKGIVFMASAKKALKEMPDEVQGSFGFKLDRAQMGKHPEGARPLGEGLPSDILKLVDNSDGETYRAAYVVAFAGVVYVLDAFQKKSKTGKETPRLDKERVKHRYELAKAHYEGNKHKYLEAKPAPKGSASTKGGGKP